MNILNWQKFLEQVGDKPISNIPFYNENMLLSMEDKLFFVDKVDFDVLVDFGGADGSVIKNIIKRKPNKFYIIYDIEPDQIKKAKENLKEYDNVLITDNWDEIVEKLNNFKIKALNLSSVIHEVYSYSHPKEVKHFWDKKVFGGLFDYIIIRDMIPSISVERIKDFKEEVNILKDKANPEQLESFENVWGSVDSNYRTFLHFLLKYKYKDNWEREVNENYIPLTIETLRKKISNKFEILYKDNYVLDFLNKEVKKDFGFEIKSPTHTKMIIKKI